MPKSKSTPNVIYSCSSVKGGALARAVAAQSLNVIRSPALGGKSPFTNTLSRTFAHHRRMSSIQCSLEYIIATRSGIKIPIEPVEELCGSTKKGMDWQREVT